MNYIGIDIGSTASKVTVFDDSGIKFNLLMPTGWNSVETSKKIESDLIKNGINLEHSKIVATGYGRVSVPYADKTITEITCHAKGAYYLVKKDLTVIDIGGQDTKIITVENGNVTNFTMNDKCAAGTGRFIELMANTLNLTIKELAELALNGEDIKINSMCTVFAESEVISLIANGTKREDIARGVLNSIINRVKAMLMKHGVLGTVYLTGGLCELNPFVNLLSQQLGQEVKTSPMARFAGSIGGALLAKNI